MSAGGAVQTATSCSPPPRCLKVSFTASDRHSDMRHTAATLCCTNHTAAVGDGGTAVAGQQPVQAIPQLVSVLSRFPPARKHKQVKGLHANCHKARHKTVSQAWHGYVVGAARHRQLAARGRVVFGCVLEAATSACQTSCCVECVSLEARRRPSSAHTDAHTNT